MAEQDAHEGHDRWLDERDEMQRLEEHEREVRFRHVAAEVLAQVESSIVKHGMQDDVALGGGSHSTPFDRMVGVSTYTVARWLERTASEATDAAAADGSLSWVLIALEEVFEAIAAPSAAEARAEWLQVAAVAMKIVDRIDRIDRLPLDVVLAEQEDSRG